MLNVINRTKEFRLWMIDDNNKFYLHSTYISLNKNRLPVSKVNIIAK